MGQAQVRFVDERGRLQRVITIFASKIHSGNAAQFFIDQGNQAVFGRAVPLFQFEQ
jgi:hypothetical protein